MRINRAVGLGVALLVLQFLAIGIWTALEGTIITTLRVTETALGTAERGFTKTPAFMVPTIPHAP